MSHKHLVIVVEGNSEALGFLQAQLQAWVDSHIIDQWVTIAEDCVPLDHTKLSPHLDLERDMGIAVGRIMHDYNAPENLKRLNAFLQGYNARPEPVTGGAA